MQNPLQRFVPHLVGRYPRAFEELMDQVAIPNGTDREEVRQQLWKAYEYGSQYHEGQKRRSGDPYFNHCLQVAKTLASWKMDHTTIMGGLLHDALEDTQASYPEISTIFGPDVANLVDGVTKLGGIHFSSREAKQAGNFMKMLLSVAKDLRVIIIKFADRIHNMETIRYMPRIKQHRIAIETRDVYAPLAHRLGMARVKWTLDDLVFQTLNPKSYREIDAKLKSTHRQRDKHIREITQALDTELKHYGNQAHIYGRAKTHASIYGKMVQRDKSFEEIYDLLAIRIVVEKVEQCYLALGVIHQKFKPIQERFKDFIATPKTNAYQSIHTTVVGPGGRLVEIQIRTQKMEATAEIGVAAHWHYKEDGKVPREVDTHIRWFRELLDILQSEENDPREFMHLLKIDLFNDEIFVFTPKGDLVQLPVGATPIDFAFQVHSEVGFHCLGTKVNHKVVPLNNTLKNGDTVEIITSKNQRPSYGWLKVAVTSKARNHINRYLRRARREESIKLGQELMEKSLRRLKMKDMTQEIQAAYAKFGLQSTDQLLEEIGKGALTVRDILQKLAPAKEQDLGEEITRQFSQIKPTGIKLQGITDLMVSLGKCCGPIPGDEMVGFITRGRGITVHRVTCTSLPLLSAESDRLVPVEWDVGRKDVFNVRLKVVAQDRKGMLKEITETIASQNINIHSVDMKTQDAIASAFFIIQINNLRQLDRLIKRLSKIQGIDFVERSDR